MSFDDFSYEDIKKHRHEIKLRKKKDHFTITIDGFPYQVRAKKINGNQMEISYSGKTYRCVVSEDGDHRYIFLDGNAYKLIRSIGSTKAGAPVESLSDNVTAPMPGVIIKLLVKVGEKIKLNQQVIVLEAMKMQNTLVAPFTGTVTKIYYNIGDQVDDGALLIDIKPDIKRNNPKISLNL